MKISPEIKRYKETVSKLNAKELRGLRGENTEQVIYGYIPLMVSANCIYKTNAACRLSHKNGVHKAYLKDRYDKVFTALTNCKYCYNIIYNSVPLSLHKKYNNTMSGFYRLQFSLENAEDMQYILDYYEKWMKGVACDFPIKEYTTAHENRQVEQVKYGISIIRINEIHGNMIQCILCVGWLFLFCWKKRKA